MSILESIQDADGEERITVGEIVHLIGAVSFAPLLIVPAIALVSPLSGIPMFSAMMGVIIFLVSVQMLFHRTHLWLPGWILRLRARRTRVKYAFQKLHPLVRWLDRHTKTRLVVLTDPPFVVIPQLICVLSGMVLPLMELVPFSSSMIGLSVALLSIGIFTRDGVLLTLALVPYALIAGLLMRII
jgi:hypothetical protein